LARAPGARLALSLCATGIPIHRGPLHGGACPGLCRAVVPGADPGRATATLGPVASGGSPRALQWPRALDCCADGRELARAHGEQSGALLSTAALCAPGRGAVYGTRTGAAAEPRSRAVSAGEQP